MKQSSIISGAVGLLAGLGLLASSSVFAASPKAPAPKVPAGTYNITFDNFSDGMQITVPGAAGAPGAQAVRVGGGVDGQPLYGAAGPHGVVLADETNLLLVVIKPDRTWIYYGDDGTGHETVFNSGTWSFGTPAAPNPGALPSTARGLFSGASASAARLPGPRATTRDIHFVGFCDGESINIPGSAGAPGLDGVQTGCTSGALLGAKDHRNIAAMWSDSLNVMWVLLPDQTWIIYNDCGDGTECVVNSGEWAYGAPSAPQGRTAISSSLRR